MQGLIGARVIRGPDWKWKNQDGGEGHCGTVRAFEGTRDVVVIWDNGTSANYRCAGAFDLRVWDSSPAGQPHEGTTCEGCSLSPICGQRFTCTACQDVDLCSWCYHGDKHNLKHRFLRQTLPGGERTEPLEKRSKSKKMQLKGFFPGAKVVRGTDWEWENQDGGPGRVGKIYEIQDWSPARPRSAVQVQWASSTKNLYRLGFQGMVDVKVIQEGKGGMVYRDHLPALGQRSEPAGPTVDLIQGDLVRLSIDQEHAQQLQDNPSMAGIEQVVGVVGTFQALNEGKAVVTYPGGLRWTVQANLLVKVASRSQERRSTGIPATALLTQQDTTGTPGTPGTPATTPISVGSADVPRRRAGTRGAVMATPTSSGSALANTRPSSATTSTTASTTQQAAATSQAPILRQASAQALVSATTIDGLPAGTGAPQRPPLPQQASAPDVRRSPARQSHRDGRDRGAPPTTVGSVMSSVVTGGGTPPVSSSNAGPPPPSPAVPLAQLPPPLQPQPAAVPVSAAPPASTSTGPAGETTPARPAVNVGDMVQVAAQEEQVRQMQRGHGEWADSMKQILGKIGRVSTKYPNGDLQVEVAGSGWTLNPMCVTRLALNEVGNSQGQDHQVSEILQQVFELQAQVGHNTTERLVKAAVIGDLATIEELFNASTAVSVDDAVSGYTALHAACQHGHLEVVKYLLFKLAATDNEDADGNRPIHLAAAGDYPEIIEVLAEAGADLSARNKRKQSSVHLAVSKGNTLAVKAMLKMNCHCSLQDVDGETPLHEAITRRREGLVQILLEAGADVTLTNKNGFNCLHHTALRGNASAMRLILGKISNRLWLVNEKKDDGYTALHLASLNNHTEVAELLVEQGKAQKDVQNINLQTPLHLAVERQHMHIIKLLIAADARVDICDKEGDTVLHEAVRHHTMQQLKQLQANTDVSMVVAGVGDKQQSASIALFLSANGVNPEVKNNKGQSALDLCPDPVLKKALMKSYKPKASPVVEEEDPLPPPANDPRMMECMICADQMRNCAFAPCGHVATCSECGERCKKCLICKEAVVERSAIEEECLVCSDTEATILFKPCCHVMACERCAAVVKKCLLCREPVVDRVPLTELVAEIANNAGATNAKGSTETGDVAMLQQQLEDIRDQTQCPVCMDRRKNLIFLCGHGTCQMCGDRMKECPICRKPIEQRIVLF
ncbi:E3 ubiquitin-protein ligase mib1-like [Sycon ciliatum]|uniref:E3 ubiquitin-protein ligase mib1-like n=1 Tax=Sycon ciliatum TaxID=27933 RepID=UPI0020A99471|eukprot:scpid22363/ scgid17199/ E3 ubiquitin-protein ligase mib1; Mind bomb homolog 1